MHIKPSQLVEALCLTVPYSPAMIWGAPGVGKSQIIQGGIDKIFAAAAKGRNVPAGVKPVLFERRINDYDLLDFAGLPHIVDGVQKRALPDLWPGVGSDEPVYGILFWDEFTQGGREKQTVGQRVLDEGRVGDYVLPGHPKADPDCKLGLVVMVLAGNRQSDRANSHGMGTQTGSRLVHFTLAPDGCNSPDAREAIRGGQAGPVSCAGDGGLLWGCGRRMRSRLPRSLPCGTGHQHRRGPDLSRYLPHPM